MLSFFRLAVVTALLTNSLVSFGTELEPNASWPQWRGPHRDSRLSVDDWPNVLSEAALKEVWKRPLGPGYSGPIVSEERMFVTETKDRRFEVVRALNRQTGEQIWETSWEGAMEVPFFAKSNGDWIRATPAFDGERLYVAGMRDVLVCLNAADGSEVWRVDFAERLKTPLPQFGFASSPLLVDEFVVVQAGGSVIKLDKLTGDIIWRALEDGGGMNGSAFSSPTVATIHGVQQVVVQTRTALAGVDLSDGSVLWSHDVPAFRGMNILTPTVIDDAVFTSSYGGETFLFDIVREGSTFSVQERWSNKSQGYMSSPVLIDDHVFLHLRNQRFCCIELATGKTKWTTTPYGKYWSMVATDNQILALDQRGELMLIAPNSEEFELIGRRTVSEEETWAHLAIVGRQIFVRDLAGITAHQWGE